MEFEFVIKCTLDELVVDGVCEGNTSKEACINALLEFWDNQDLNECPEDYDWVFSSLDNDETDVVVESESNDCTYKISVKPIE